MLAESSPPLLGEQELGREAPDRGVRVACRPHDGVVVLRPQGALDADAIGALVELVDRSDGPTIVDFDDCIVVDPVVAERMAEVNELRGRNPLCAVCHRLSARRLLARSRAMRNVMLFRSVDEAIQALVLAQHGFGRGWEPA